MLNLLRLPGISRPFQASGHKDLAFPERKFHFFELKIFATQKLVSPNPTSRIWLRVYGIRVTFSMRVLATPG